MWSYDASMAEKKDEVRFLCGDTDTTDRLLQDEEIERLLVIYPSVGDSPAFIAGAAACDAIASKFARLTQKSIGTLSSQAQQKYEHYKELGQQLRSAYQTKGIGPRVSGVVPVAAPILGGGGRTILGG